jgi:hypothetical protein
MLAILYDLHLAAVWRGEDASNEFGAWLEGRWWAGGLAEPETPPDAVSVLGGAGAGIRWYGVGENILGFVGGRPRGCHVVACDDVLPNWQGASIDSPAAPASAGAPAS